MENLNISYEPVTWSCYGRPHPSATKALSNLAKRASRRRGLQMPDVLLRRSAAAISTEIWRRTAKMAFACWPKDSELADDDAA